MITAGPSISVTGAFRNASVAGFSARSGISGFGGGKVPGAKANPFNKESTDVSPPTSNAALSSEDDEQCPAQWMGRCVCAALILAILGLIMIKV